jgi:hypothetical protein
MAELRIPIIVENKGKKAFKETDKAITGLTKNFKKLAGAAGIGLSTAAVINFGKKAAAAFIADEKAARQLAIAVKNLGIAFETPRIESFISDLSMATGVADDQLRPAMQKLLTTTGSVTKAQELLSQAIDISAGSGVAFETVAQDLASAYVGQTRGIRKYNLGITQAELKTMKFADIQERLNKQFSGANAEYLTTYAGKLQLISTAAGEASEKIGKSLVESLVSVFAAGDTTRFVEQIDELATKIANVVNSVVFGFKKLYILTSDRAILASFNPFDDYEKNALAAIEAAEKAAKFRLGAPSMGYQGSRPIGIYATPAQQAAAKKLEADAARRARELASSQAKQLAEQKKKLALEKASKTLELDRINLTAALKGKISETDRISLQLQLALLDKNDSLATKLSAELEAATKRQQTLNAALLATPEAPNPYRNWVPPALQSMYDSQQYFGPQGGLGAGVVAGVNPPVNVQVVIDGKEVASAVTDVQVNQSLSGTFSDVNRVAARGSVGIR